MIAVLAATNEVDSSSCENISPPNRKEEALPVNAVFRKWQAG